MGAIATADLLGALDIEAKSETRLRVAESASERRTRARKRPAKASEELQATLYRQGNWKRRDGVATRHELASAIERLLERGQVAIDGGVLTLGKVAARRITPKAVRWAAKDDDLRTFCQRIEVHETRSKRNFEVMEASAGSMFEASVYRGSPRKGVGKYVLRELRENGPAGYEALINTIVGAGGLEWVNEEARPIKGALRRKKR